METTAGLAERVVAAARTAEKSEASEDWDSYGKLVWDASAEQDGEPALRCGLGLLGSADPLERSAGCDLLRDASNRYAAVRAEAATALVDLAGREREPCALQSLVQGLAMTYDPRAVPVMVDLSWHPDAEVRLEVASSINSVPTGLPDGPDVSALIRLTRDNDPEVRNWATFSLGFQLETDSAAIRDALWERTTDEYGEAREEGIRGLARRHDPRSVQLVAELLHAPDGAHYFTFDVAEILGVPELLPYLDEYEPDSYGVAKATQACDPVLRARTESDAWEIVLALHRLRPDLDAAVRSPRYESVLQLQVTVDAAAVDSYDAASLLARAGGDAARAAELVVADLAVSGPPAGGPSGSSG